MFIKFRQVSRQSRIHYSSVYLAMVLGMLANVGFSTRACVAKRATRRNSAGSWINSQLQVEGKIAENQSPEMFVPDTSTESLGKNKALVFESKDPLEVAEIGLASKIHCRSD